MAVLWQILIVMYAIDIAGQSLWRNGKFDTLDLV